MKKVRPEIKFKGHGGLTDAFDDMIKQLFNITDDEYDYICMNSTDDELDQFALSSKPTFAEKRAALNIRNKFVQQYHEQHTDNQNT
jgi:spermidine synthase